MAKSGGGVTSRLAIEFPLGANLDLSQISLARSILNLIKR